MIPYASDFRLSNHSAMKLKHGANSIPLPSP